MAFSDVLFHHPPNLGGREGGREREHVPRSESNSYSLCARDSGGRSKLHQHLTHSPPVCTCVGCGVVDAILAVYLFMCFVFEKTSEEPILFWQERRRRNWVQGRQLRRRGDWRWRQRLWLPRDGLRQRRRSEMHITLGGAVIDFFSYHPHCARMHALVVTYIVHDFRLFIMILNSQLER